MKPNNNPKAIYLIIADIINKKLYVTSETMKEARKFGSVADELINQYRKKYPRFTLETNDLYVMNFILG